MRALSTEAKKGITVKVDVGLHAEVTQYLEEHGMTMGEFVTLALTDELHPKIQVKEGIAGAPGAADRTPLYGDF